MIRLVVPVLVMIFYLPIVSAGTVNFGGFSGGNFTIPVTSLKEQRFKTIYKQQYDFSCGSATLASLLTFHYDDVIEEYDVFADMFEHGDQEKIKVQGFSLLDMKQFLERRGYRSNGFKISLEQLANAQIPAITIINQNGYLHFVIIKSSNDKEVLVGDPSVGLKVFPKEEFEQLWGQRIMFVIQDKRDIATAYYNDKSEWEFKVRANLGLAVDYSSLGLFNMLQPPSMDF